MQERRSLWKKMEKYVIYSTLSVYFVLQLGAIFIPSIARVMNAGGSLAFIAGVLLIIFHFLDERLDARTGFIKSSKNFVESVSDFLRQNKEYKNVDILAQNGFLYCTVIKESGIKIKNLRLLLRNTKDLTTIQSPNDEKSRESLQQAILSFKLLQQSGIITKISIAYYEFNPTTYFMSLDGKSLHFGLYQPKIAEPGADITNSFFVSYDGQGEYLIQDFNNQFEAFWAKYNVPMEKQNSAPK